LNDADLARDLIVIEERFGAGNWRKRKGFATVRIEDGTMHEAEVHWYEADGIVMRLVKIKRISNNGMNDTTRVYKPVVSITVSLVVHIATNSPYQPLAKIRQHELLGEPRSGPGVARILINVHVQGRMLRVSFRRQLTQACRGDRRVLSQ